MDTTENGLRRTGRYVKPTVPFRETTVGQVKYCFGHKEHRASKGGRLMGPHRMYYCAECVQARLAKQGATK